MHKITATSYEDQSYIFDKADETRYTVVVVVVVSIKLKTSSVLKMRRKRETNIDEYR